MLCQSRCPHDASVEVRYVHIVNKGGPAEKKDHARPEPSTFKHSARQDHGSSRNKCHTVDGIYVRSQLVVQLRGLSSSRT
jgi:hypothetical protein